eukprot:8165248-Ditylum_brightwellii.AAC.1
MFATRTVSQKKLRKATQLVRATPREEGSAKPNAKLTKRLTMTGDNILQDAIQVTKDIRLVL